MAEFCLECWNKLNDIQLSEKDAVIREEYDLCEGCGEIKRTIGYYRKRNTCNRIIECIRCILRR